jgi:hypothetical protein
MLRRAAHATSALDDWMGDLSATVKQRTGKKPRRAKRPRRDAAPESFRARTEPVSAERDVGSGYQSAALYWLGSSLIAIAGFAMLYLSWRTWPDVLIDFGRELYVPWRLAAGQTLYTDIAYFNGPLSPYWNALWFRLFGTGLMTLVASNLVLLAVLTALLYRLLLVIGTPVGATAACLVFVTLFAFGQFLGVGNYSFVTPYSHDLTHAVLLSIVGLSCLRLYQQRHRLIFIAAAGVATGLLVLTKVEVLLAGGVAMMLGIGLTLGMERAEHRRVRDVAAAFLGAAAVPPAVAVGLFSLAMPVGAALKDSLGYWLSASRAGVVASPFYRQGMGIDDVGKSLTALFTCAFWYAVTLGPVAGLALALRKPGRYRLAVAGAAFAAVAAMLGAYWREIAWQEVGRALPLCMLALAVTLAVTYVRRLRRSEIDHPLVLRVSMVVFALGLLGKMILNVRIYHYGFALAMPATLLLVLALLDWAPAAIDQVGGSGVVFRGAALAAILVSAVVYLSVTDGQIRRRVHTVSSGADAFLADGRGVVVNKALEVLRNYVQPDQTLAVFPEGVMLNYLSRHVNPTPYTVFIPIELAMFGEDRMVASLQAHPPDYVMLVHRDTSEYGVPYFGRDYGYKTSSWIAANYRPALQIGPRPFQDGRFGMMLLQRTSGR